MAFLWLDINASWSHSSLALPALHANLEPEVSARCNMQVVRGTIKSNPSQIVDEALCCNPSFIFATAWLFNVEYLKQILCRVHSIMPSVQIFLGGPEFLGNNEEFLRSCRYVTAVFKGEGEDIFNPFITSLLNNDEKWKELPGFEWIEDDAYKASPAVAVKDFPALRNPMESSLFSWDKSFVQIETSRGCFNSCRFCVSGIDKSKVQDIPVPQLRSLLQKVADKGIREVRILDRTFNANPLRALELINLFGEFAGKLNFHLEIHPALLHCVSDSSPVAKLREALANVPDGLLHLEAGIQTLQQDVLDTCARKGSCANAVEGLKFLIGCKKFEVHADLIAGLPGYTFDNLVDDTMQLMQIGPGEIQLELLKLLPGTHFRIACGEYGIKHSPVTPYEVLQTPSVSFRELNMSTVLSRALDLWYNDSKWREPFGKIFTGSRDLFMSLIDWLFNGDLVSQPLSLEGRGMLLYRFCREFAPQYCPLVSLQWVRNGLSMKKEPAESFVKWEIRDTQTTNPLFVEGDPRYKYHYIDIESARHWFSFNKEIERIAPCGYAVEELAL